MEVIWSQSALRHLRDMAQYVADNFGQRVAIQSVEKIQKKASALAKFPESGVLDRKYTTAEYTVHHFTLAPNVVYYMLFPDAIVIGAIVHTRQSPKTVDRILKDFLEHYKRQV